MYPPIEPTPSQTKGKEPHPTVADKRMTSGRKEPWLSFSVYVPRVKGKRVKVEFILPRLFT